MSTTRRGPAQRLVAVEPDLRLLAAIQCIEEQIEILPERHQDPWTGRPGHSGWTDIVSEAWDRDGNGHRSFVCQVQESRTADHIVVAVNAMPSVAVLLRAVYEHVSSHDCEAHCEPDGCDTTKAAFALADQILGGQR